VTHRLPLRVYYEDTDAGGIVYYANYLKFAERARTELLRSAGLDHPRLLTRHGGLFAVRRCHADFRAPARLDDLLEVRTGVARAGGARVVMAQSVHAGARLLVSIETELAFLDRELRPRRLPEPVRLALTTVATPD
jgi:acyl-CoA thioester hydrolase